MTALAAARSTKRLGSPNESNPSLLKLPMKASTKIYKGAMVCIDAGYAAPARTATGLLVVGKANDTVDNSSGSAGALYIEVEQGPWSWANSASGDQLTAADIGKVVYAVDDQTVAKTDATGTRSAAGRLFQVEADGTIYVLQGFAVL